MVFHFFDFKSFTCVAVNSAAKPAIISTWKHNLKVCCKLFDVFLLFYSLYFVKVKPGQFHESKVKSKIPPDGIPLNFN